MKIDDEELGRMLRQVEIPADLTQRLREIPISSVELKKTYGPKDWKRSYSLAFAAALLGLAAFGTWYLVLSRNERLQNQTATQDVRQNSGTNKMRNDTPRPSFEKQWSELKAELNAITDSLTLVEIERLRKKKETFESTIGLADVDRRDQESLIIGLSDQSALDWGGDLASVRRDMTRLKDRYPDSSGAKLANEFLNRETF